MCENIRIENFIKGYIHIRTCDKHYVMALEEDIESILEIVSILNNRIVALCHTKRWGNIIRWIEIPEICDACV